MMTVLYGIGTVLRFILRIVLLPVQAVLTLLMLAIFYWWLGKYCMLVVRGILCDWWYLFIY